MKRILSVLLVLTLLVTDLPLSALAGGGTDTNAFILPSGLHEVKAGAFAGNTLLSTLVVPNTVTSIGSEAFKNCTGLSEVSIASREITIADDAFADSLNVHICGTFDSAGRLQVLDYAYSHGIPFVEMDW